MNLKSSGPISKSINGKFDKQYSSLRYRAPRPIPTNDELDLTKEEDFLHPEEPKPQEYLANKVFSWFRPESFRFRNNSTPIHFRLAPCWTTWFVWLDPPLSTRKCLLSPMFPPQSTLSHLWAIKVWRMSTLPLQETKSLSMFLQRKPSVV